MKTKIICFVTLLTSFVTFSQQQWTLKQCVQHALEKNITIQRNKLNLESSKTDIKSAKGNFLPSVNASTNGNLNFGSTFDPVSNNRVSTTTFGGSLGVNAQVNIFNGFRNLNTYKQAELGVKSSELNLKIIENDISLQVINTYLNVLFAKENLEVAKVQSEISQKQIKRIKEQFNAGTVAKTVLLNAKSSASNDTQNVITSENNLELALLRLAQLIQTPSENFDVKNIAIDNVSEALFYKDYNEVYKKALENRPEIQQGKLTIENSDLNIELAKSGYLPRVTASGIIGTNYGYNLDLPNGTYNPELGTQLDQNLGYGVGFNVTIPIFNGFKNDANVEKAKINKKINETQLENQKLQLKQTIQQAYLDAKLALKTYQTSKIAVDAQKEAFKNAQTSYDYGQTTIFDFDQVRNRLFNAESSLIRAKYDYVFKQKVLQFYFGESVID